MNRRISPVLADLMLLGVALIWGLTFPVTKNALDDISVYSFLSIRFSIASIFIALFFLKAFKSFNRQYLYKGMLIGTVLFGGYAFQTVGLQYTSCSNSSFISGLYVVLVPLLNIFFTKKLPKLATVLGSLLAAIGLGLLSLQNNLSIQFGDLLTLFGAIFFAFHIVLVSRFAPLMNANLLTIIQLSAVTFYCTAFAVNLETYPSYFTNDVSIALLICAVPATSIAYLIQNKAQQYTSPAKTAIIFSMEPVFGAMFSFLLLGETLSMKGFIGCGFVLTGMLFAELKS